METPKVWQLCSSYLSYKSCIFFLFTLPVPVGHWDQTVLRSLLKPARSRSSAVALELTAVHS